MTTTLTILTAILSSSVICTFLQLCFAAWDKRKKKESSTNDGVRILLYDKIKYLGKKYITDGSITSEDLEDLIAMHNIYHEMGGNGFLDKVMAAVKALPLK